MIRLQILKESGRKKEMEAKEDSINAGLLFFLAFDTFAMSTDGEIDFVGHQTQ